MHSLPLSDELANHSQADWDAVAAVNNHKDAAISRQRWSQVRRKKIDNKNTGDSPAKPTGVAKKSPSKRTPGASKVKHEPTADHESTVDGEAATAGQTNTPSKRKRSAKVKTEVVDEDGADADSMQAQGSEDENANGQDDQSP